MEKIAIQTLENITNENKTLFYGDPLIFFYAPKSSEAEAKRQYPARLMKFSNSK